MEPAIDSIIQSWNKDKWKKLDQRHEIAQLHERFWCQGAYKDELLNTPEDEDSEIGPGCFVLDIGIPELKPTEVWVRKEYIRIYKYCHEYLEANRNENMAPAVVVTGQPGIGKSYWLHYALCRQLVQKKPIIWYYVNQLFLFVAEGVYATDSNYSCIGYKTRIWTLVDVERDKTSAMTMAIMNPWTREEISEAAPLHGFQANNRRLDEMYNRSAPQLASASITPSDHCSLLQEMVNGIFSPEAYKMSNTIILLKRLPGKEYHHKTLEPVTPTVEMDLREQLRRETHAQRLELYHHLTNVETSKSLVGVVYESLIQDKFRQQATISLDLVPMARRGRGQHPPWCFDHGSGASSIPYEINRTDNDVYSAWPSPLHTNVYYSPKSPNQVGHDAFIIDGASRQLFIFQFTIAKRHQIKKGLFDFFSQNSPLPKASWHFVFIVSSTSELSCPYPTGDADLGALLEEIRLYTMVEDPQPLPVLVPQPQPQPQPPQEQPPPPPPPQQQQQHLQEQPQKKQKTKP
ncbi:hypothetical protein EI94DRAFT_1792232 [Lactarius quietus]|nr:hypothetical protein EI94DRAFT_1792232 [Lactarius quietus]